MGDPTPGTPSASSTPLPPTTPSTPGTPPTSRTPGTPPTDSALPTTGTPPTNSTQTTDSPQATESTQTIKTPQSPGSTPPTDATKEDIAQIVEFAGECVELLRSRTGKDLDYSPSSLDILDEVLRDIAFSQAYIDAKFPGGDERYTYLIFMIGSYFGLVIKKHIGGKWKRNDSGWCVDIDGTEVNVYHIVDDCFKEPPKLRHTFDTVQSVAKPKKDQPVDMPIPQAPK